MNPAEVQEAQDKLARRWLDDQARELNRRLLAEIMSHPPKHRLSRRQRRKYGTSAIPIR